METMTPKVLCPVCGYGLGFAPWVGNSASDELCPCCDIQFGYDDAAGGNFSARQVVYQEWRSRWIKQGMPWRSRGTRLPNNWDPVQQLHDIGVNAEEQG